MKRVVLLIVALSTLCVLCVTAQEDQDNYFTGTLVENTANHLKVSRVLQGKTEERVFKLNAQTKDGRRTPASAKRVSMSGISQTTMTPIRRY